MENISNFNPVLLFSNKYDGFEYFSEEHKNLTPRYVKDIEIDYYLRSNGGGINVDGEFIEYKRGDIAIRFPGQLVYGVNPYSCYFLCIDSYGRTERADNYIIDNFNYDNNDTRRDISKKFDNEMFNSLPNRISCDKTDYAGKIIEALYLENLAIKKDSYREFKIKTLLFQLFNELFSINRKNNFDTNSIDNVIAYIHSHFTEEINVSELIDMSNMSKAVFHKKFKIATDYIPLEYITNLRIKKAQYCLLNGYSVSETAALCGWFDSVYFSSVFKKHTGITPSLYKNILSHS